MSKTRIALVVVGFAVVSLAAWKLALAAVHAFSTGSVLLGETTRTAALRGVTYPYPAYEAWAYFVGWAAIALSGALLATASMSRLGRLLLAPVALLFGFILIAAAPMLGSISGVVLFLTVVVGCSMVAVLIALWPRRSATRLEASGNGETV